MTKRLDEKQDDFTKLSVKLAEMNDAEIPKCKKCGHEICVHCGNWCDVLLPDENGNNTILCCDGGCEVERN